MIFSLATKLKGLIVLYDLITFSKFYKCFSEKNRHTEFNKISKTFNDILPELSKDNQPEIKSRVTDIKNLLNKN